MSRASLFTRVLGSSAGDAVDICSTSGTIDVAFGVQLGIVESSACERVYRVRVTSRDVQGWKRLVPVDRTETGTTWGVDVLVNNAVATFRLVRIQAAAGGPTTLACKVMAASAAGGTVAIAGSEAAATSGVTNTGTYEGALLTQVDGKVGIGTENPSTELDVQGHATVSGNMVVGASLRASTLTTTTGNVLLQNLSRNITGNAVYVDVATGRLHYGELVSSVDGMRNTVISQTISDGVTTTAPSEDAVFDALALKANAANASITGTLSVSGNATVGNLSATQIVNTGTSYRISDQNVLTATTLGSGVVNSSLTSVGDLGSLQVTGNATLGNVTTNAVTATAIAGASLNLFGNVSAGNLSTNAVVASTLSLSGNLGAGNLSTNAILASAISASSTLIVTGNATTGNLSTNAVTSTTLTASGNVLTGNLSTNAVTATTIAGSSLSTSGNVTCGNLSTNAVVASTLSLSGNLGAGNLSVADQLSTSNLSVSGEVNFLGLLWVDMAAQGNTLLDAKANVVDVYTRTQLDGGQLDARYYTETEVNTLLAGKEGTIAASTAATYFRGDKTFQTLNTAAVAESAGNLYFTNARAQAAAVSQTVSDGVTATAPSENAVFDALSLKADAANASISGTLSATGNASVGNLSANAVVATTIAGSSLGTSGNVTCGNLSTTAVTATTITLSGNLLAGNLSTNAITATAIAASANVQAGNLSTNAITATAVSASTLALSGNAALGNLSTNAIVASTLSLSGNLTAGSVRAANVQANVLTLPVLATRDSTGNALYVDAASGTVTRGQGLDTDYNWTLRQSAADNWWTSIVWGANTFVALAGSGTGNRVMTSPDGVTWTIRTSAADSSWTSVTWGSGTFVAVAIGGNRVMTSPDGINWTARNPASVYFTDITWGAGRFVALAPYDSGVNTVWTSPDGITWTGGPGAIAQPWAITFGNGLFVVVAPDFVRVMTSPDGITWTAQYSAPSLEWRSVTWGSGTFVAVASSGTGNRVMTSPDGISWTSRQSAADYGWRSVSWGNGLFVAVAGAPEIMTSPDGITWSLRTSAADNSWMDVAYGNGVFAAVASSGTGNRVMTWKYPNNLRLDADLKVSGNAQIGNVSTNAITATAITASTLSLSGNLGAGNVSTNAIAATTLTTTGNVLVNGNTLVVDAVSNRVGINRSAPTQALDVAGSALISGNLACGNLSTNVLTATAITGSTLSASGNVTCGNLSTNAMTASTLSLTGNLGAGNLATNAITATTMTLSGNASVANLTAGQVVNAGLAYRIGNTDVLTSTSLGAGITGSSLTSVGVLGSLQVSGNAQIGNVSATAITASTLSVSGNVQTGNLAASTLALTGNAAVGNLSASSLTLNNAVWASSVVYGSTVPFTYNGPGTSGNVGVPFYAHTTSTGTSFVTASGNGNAIFTFATSGTYMLQAEVDAGFPFFPEADLSTYFLRNGNVSTKLGKEAHSPSSFACTRPYLITASANDDVRFVIDSAAGNDYEVGLNAVRLTILKFT